MSNRNTCSHAHWSAYDSARLVRLVLLHGHRWDVVAREMDRSPAAVRNRFKRIAAEHGGGRGETATEGKHRCAACGRLKRGHVCSVSPASSSESGDTFGEDNYIESLWK